MKITNDTARSLEAGSVIERTYWAVPGFYGEGPHFETEVEAIEYAVDKMKSRVNQFAGDGRPVPEKMLVELRWHVKRPHGSVDFPASRTTYEDIADAEAHLARIAKFATPRRSAMVAR